MNKENILYVKIKNGIFKCYKSEQMHKPIYYPVESKTNGYIDYNDVEKILTIEDLYQENQELKKQLEELKTTNKVLSEELTKDKILKQDCLTTCCGIPIGDIPKLITQQKEFIKFLEDNYKETQDIWYIKILQKYKSIIGVSDEKK